LGHQQLPVSPADHPSKTAPAEPVGGEALLFECQQRWNVFNDRQAKNRIHMAAVKVV
jgi:hypothetical protein